MLKIKYLGWSLPLVMLIFHFIHHSCTHSMLMKMLMLTLMLKNMRYFGVQEK